MSRIQYVIFFILAINIFLVYGYDEQTEFKLIAMKKHKPTKNAILLEWDKSFSIQNNSEESFLKMPTSFQIYDNKLFIVDNNLNKINVYSKSGIFLKSIGQRGRGPGDFSSPNWLQSYNGNLYVQSNNGIDVFSKSFEFIKRIRTFHNFPKFLIYNNSIYCVLNTTYKGQKPFFVKMNLHGGIQQAVYEKDLEDRFYDRVKFRTQVLIAQNHILVIPDNWNTIYIYGNDLNLIKKVRLAYPLLDELEKWNERDRYKKDFRVVWPARLYASMKTAGDKVYLLMQLPRLEIVAIDSEGRIDSHYYNYKPFSLMRWYDFAVRKENSQLVFYIIGRSMDDNMNESMQEYNVFRVIPKSGKMIYTSETIEER